MKATVKSFGFKLWTALVLFTAVIFAVLWLLQTVFLQTFYTDMAVSELKKTASEIAAGKDGADFLAAVEETARKNSLLIFLTDSAGQVLYSADEYSSMYGDSHRGDSHGGDNPYFSGDGLNWQKGAIRNLPDNHMELIRELAASGESSLGRRTPDGTAYVYGVKLGACGALSAEDVILCVSSPLDSVEGAVGILRRQLLWVSLLSLSLACVLALFLSRRFGKPIRGITARARSLSQGNFRGTAPKGFCAELDELSDTLNDTAASLERLERSRQELLANVSHDLRTPLTMIRGYAEMVREISGSDAEARDQDLGIIIRETDRLTALVNEILEYSAMRTQGQKPEMTVFDLSEAVTEVLHRFEPLCASLGCAVVRSVEPDIRVTGSRAQIERVIYNFVDNAVNHTDPARGVAVTLCARENAARLEVRDYGPGIPAEELPYIWDRYYTSRNRKNKAAVSGLGLSIAKEILTLHEADFGADSEDGCVFWFELHRS